MLFVLGSILAGVLLYDHCVDNAKRPMKEDSEQQTEKNVLTGIYHIRSGDGELDLPPCRFMAVELGLSTDPNKAILQIMVNKSVETECKLITDIEKDKKYVKLTPTQYQTIHRVL